MANQLNFGNPLTDYVGQRMIRLTEKDHNAVLLGEKTVLFGTNGKHNIELWFYYTDGEYAGSIRLDATDESIRLLTNLDVDGQAYEYVTLNLEDIISRVALEPGRYSMSVYVLQDEVSSKNSDNKLVIRQISQSRKEVVLTPETASPEILKEIYEFVVPSVPRIYAKALVDQTFGKSTGGLEAGEAMTPASISNQLSQDILVRINRARAALSYQALINEVINRSYYRIVDAIANDYLNKNVQETELMKYINDEIKITLDEIEAKLELDPRLDLV